MAGGKNWFQCNCFSESHLIIMPFISSNKLKIVFSDSVCITCHYAKHGI